jgi:hypothetical protein
MPVAGGGSMALVWELRCPPCNRAMIAGQALDQLLDRIRPRRASPHDRSAARRIPQEYLERGGHPVTRVMDLVRQSWSSYAEADQRELGQVLLEVLAPLGDKGPDVAVILPDECERVVVTWMERPRHAFR